MNFRGWIIACFFSQNSYPGWREQGLLLIMLLCGPLSGIAQSNDQSERTIQGFIQDVSGSPIANAEVVVKNTFKGTLSGDDGVFILDVSPGDVLVASAFLMKTKEVKVPSATSLTIQLEPNAELLNAIILRQKNEKERLVSTPFREVKQSAFGYNREVVGNSEFWPGDVSIYESIIRHPFVQENNGSLIFQRSRGWIKPLPALVIVDNVPVGQSILQQLNPHLVESVTMVSSLAGSVKYGSLGAGGVIYIKTKIASNPELSDKLKKRFTPIEGNDYTEQPLSISESLEESNYISALKKAPSFEQAKSLYYSQTATLGISSMAYYLDAATYFDKWNAQFSHQILSQMFKLSDNNPRVLLGLAYHCEQLGRLPQAAYIYEELMVLQPDKIQSYLNLARIYAGTGNYHRANSLYRQMLFNSIQNLDFTVVEPIVIEEYKRFLAKYRSKVNFQDLPAELLVATKDKKVRIVVEWTNPSTEFEIQFVSPDKKFYTWQHSAFQNKEFIEQELARGYSIKDFTIEDAGDGEWIVNIGRLSEKSGYLPTYVKYSIYRNYGLDNETVELKVVPLDRIDEKVTLDAFAE